MSFSPPAWHMKRALQLSPTDHKRHIKPRQPQQQKKGGSSPQSRVRRPLTAEHNAVLTRVREERAKEEKRRSFANKYTSIFDDFQITNSVTLTVENVYQFLCLVTGQSESTYETACALAPDGLVSGTRFRATLTEVLQEEDDNDYKVFFASLQDRQVSRTYKHWMRKNFVGFQSQTLRPTTVWRHLCALITRSSGSSLGRATLSQLFLAGRDDRKSIEKTEQILGRIFGDNARRKRNSQQRILVSDLPGYFEPDFYQSSSNIEYLDGVLTGFRNTMGVSFDRMSSLLSNVSDSVGHSDTEESVMSEGGDAVARYRQHRKRTLSSEVTMYGDSELKRAQAAIEVQKLIDVLGFFKKTGSLTCKQLEYIFGLTGDDETAHEEAMELTQNGETSLPVTELIDMWTDSLLGSDAAGGDSFFQDLISAAVAARKGKSKNGDTPIQAIMSPQLPTTSANSRIRDILEALGLPRQRVLQKNTDLSRQKVFDIILLAGGEPEIVRLHAGWLCRDATDTLNLRDLVKMWMMLANSALPADIVYFNAFEAGVLAKYTSQDPPSRRPSSSIDVSSSISVSPSMQRKNPSEQIVQAHARLRAVEPLPDSKASLARLIVEDETGLQGRVKILHNSTVRISSDSTFHQPGASGLNETVTKHYGERYIVKPLGKERNQIHCDQLQHCEIYILENVDSAYITACTGCEVIIGPIKGECIVKNSTGLGLAVLSSTLRIVNCQNLRLNVFVSQNIVIEGDCRNISLSYWNVAYPNLNSQFDRAGFEARRNNYMRVDTSGAVSGKSSYSLVEAPPSLLILSVSPEPGQKQDIGPAEHPFPFKTYSHSQDYDNSQPNSALYMGLSPEESGGSDVSMDQQHGTSFTFDSPLVEDTPSRVSLHRRSPTPRIFMGVHPAQNDDLQHTLSLPAFSSASASPASSAAVSALSQQAKRSSQRSVKSLQTRAVKPARLMTLPVVQASARVVRICAYVPVSQLAALLAIWQFSFMEVLETLPGFESCTFSLLGEEAPVYLDSHWSSAVDAKTVCTSSHFTDAVNLLRDIEDANIFVELLQSDEARAPATAATDSKNSTSSRSSNTLARTKSTSNVSYAGASPKNFTRSLRAFDNH